MALVEGQTRAQSEIREVLDIWLAAARQGDVDRVLTVYAPEVRAFDAIGKLEFRGLGDYETHWRACMSQLHDDMLFEPHDMVIEADGDIGFAHYLAECGCQDENGEMQTGWMRGTVCLKRFGTTWRIVHEHYSNPFDPKTMKVSADLKP